jgi:hypothetical protein
MDSQFYFDRRKAKPPDSPGDHLSKRSILTRYSVPRQFLSFRRNCSVPIPAKFAHQLRSASRHVDLLLLMDNLSFPFHL